MKCRLKDLDDEVPVYISPGALASHNSLLYVNRNYVVDTNINFHQLLFILVIKKAGVVYADINTIPWEFAPPEIDNKALIEKNFLPFEPMVLVIVSSN